MNASTSGISLASSLANLCDMQPLTTSFCPGRFRKPRSWCASSIASIDSSLAESINAQVLTITTSASSASAVTSMPLATISPSITSASTRFFAQPRLIIPTLTADGGCNKSAADNKRLLGSMDPIRSVDDDIIRPARNELAVFPNLDCRFVNYVDPESFPFDDDRLAVRPGVSFKYRLGSLFILGHLYVSSPDHSNLELFIGKRGKSGLNRSISRAVGLHCIRR